MRSSRTRYFASAVPPRLLRHDVRRGGYELQADGEWWWSELAWTPRLMREQGLAEVCSLAANVVACHVAGLDAMRSDRTVRIPALADASVTRQFAGRSAQLAGWATGAAETWAVLVVNDQRVFWPAAAIRRQLHGEVPNVADDAAVRTRRTPKPNRYDGI
jgi:hypothetical protein